MTNNQIVCVVDKGSTFLFEVKCLSFGRRDEQRISADRLFCLCKWPLRVSCDESAILKRNNDYNERMIVDV